MKSNSKYGIPAIIAAVLVCILCVCCVGSGAYFYGDSLFSGTGISNPINPGNPADSGNPIVPQDTSNLPEWTVIVYEDADDEILEEDMFYDVNEMELVGSSDQVNILVQLDRAQGAFAGGDDATGTRRYYITQDNDMGSINSQVVQDMGELDMGDPQTLYDFATWAIQNYPAKKYMLVMSDHGGGWTGGFSDLQSGNQLSFAQIADTIQQIQSTMGEQKFEVVGFDACLMGMVEVYGSLYPYTNYMIGSEEVEPAPGWAYAAWLNDLVQNPTQDGRALSQSVVSSYIVQDTVLNQRSSDEVQEVEAGTTLSAVDSAQMPAVISAMNQFISSLSVIDQSWVAQGREYTLGYYSIFGEDVPSSFIDLGQFAQVMATTGEPSVQQSAEQLNAALSAAIVAEKHGGRMEGSTGMSFHFPISDIYSFTELNSDFPPLYKSDAYKFLEQSSWDEFLAYHYTGVAFNPQQGQAYEPPKSSQVVAPGASTITIDPVQVSTTNLSGDQKLTLTTNVNGDASYIYFVLYFYNPDANAYWIGDMSYVFADNTTNINGVTQPDYGASPIQISYEWDPSLFVLTDGTTEAFALFEPDEYINADGVSTYTVYGQYTPVNGTPVDAKMTFDPDGNLLHIYSLSDLDGNGITNPYEINPQIGDKFNDYVKSYYFNDDGTTTYDYSLSSDIFTYGDQGFKFEARYPVEGQYAIGFIAYDFDNNPVSSFEFVNYTP